MTIKKERGLPLIFRYVEIDVNLSYRQHKPFQVPAKWTCLSNNKQFANEPDARRLFL
jgi:hypothetical protein